MQEAYDKAGGDAALFKKLHDEWQQKQLEASSNADDANKRFEGNTEKLRGRLNEVSSSEATMRESVEQLKSQYDSAKQELDDFTNNASDLNDAAVGPRKVSEARSTSIGKGVRGRKVATLHGHHE